MSQTITVYANGYESHGSFHWIDHENAYADQGIQATTPANGGAADYFLFPDVGPHLVPDGSTLGAIVVHVEVGSGIIAAVGYLDGIGFEGGSNDVSFDVPFTEVDLAALRVASARIKANVYENGGTDGPAALDYVTLVVAFAPPASSPPPPPAPTADPNADWTVLDDPAAPSD